MGLKVLFLHGNRLLRLPQEIVELANLETLVLNSNELSALPQGFGRLSALKILGLSYNRFRSLPQEVTCLANLIEFEISDNSVSSLPATIGRLSNLRLLNLAGNELTSIPAEIGLLGKPNELNLSGNRLLAIPPEIGCLTNLREFYLGDNQLAMLPMEVGRLYRLKELGLYRNQLRKLPKEFWELTSLRSLQLSGNALTELPPEIWRLESLEELDLSENKLTTLPVDVGQLKALVELNLEHNQLKNLPEELNNHPQLMLRADPNVMLTRSPAFSGLSCREAVNMEMQRLIPLFRAAGEAHTSFHRSWNNGFKESGLSYKATCEYRNSLKAVEHATDLVCLRVHMAIGLVKAGELCALPTLLAYLMVTERYFRSGYTKGEICRILKRIDLNEEQKAVLTEAVLVSLKCAGREINEIIRLVPRIDCPAFRVSLDEIGAKGFGTRQRTNSARQATIFQMM